MSKKDVTAGIDIGGTNTAFGFIDKEGNLIAESSIPTNALECPEIYFSRLIPEVKKLWNVIEWNCELRGIGIGAPNANYYRGTVENPPNLKWGVVDVVNTFRQHFNIPVAITNDANASAIGEMLFGAAKGMKDFIVITLGTGLGSGIFSNGKLVYGSDGFAGEIGHTVYDPNGRLCGCGRRGCLETYASATGIKRTVLELIADTNIDSVLRNKSINELDSKMIYDAAVTGDKIAIDAFEYTGKILGMKLADSVAHTSPEAIIFFGGLAAAGDLILNPVKKYMEANLFHIFQNKVKILPSGLKKGNIAVLGAAALIWNEL
jgi:glucokinase